MSTTTSGFPGGGGELGDASDRPIAQFGEDVAQVLPELDVQASAGFDDRDDGGNLWTCGFIADVKPVFAIMRSSA